MTYNMDGIEVMELEDFRALQQSGPKDAKRDNHQHIDSFHNKKESGKRRLIEKLAEVTMYGTFLLSIGSGILGNEELSNVSFYSAVLSGGYVALCDHYTKKDREQSELEERLRD